MIDNASGTWANSPNEGFGGGNSKPSNNRPKDAHSDEYMSTKEVLIMFGFLNIIICMVVFWGYLIMTIIAG